MLLEVEKTFLGLPEFIWNNIFIVITTLLCGLIVAYFTSTFLKKKEERTRVAGIILEKRIESEREIMHFLEKNLIKEQLICEEEKVVIMIKDLIDKYPVIRRLQYAKIFQRKDSYQDFFKNYEERFGNNRIWLDNKVRNHLMFMDGYFSWINTIPIIVKRIPLPDKMELTEKEFERICDTIFLIYGIVLDNEINALLTKLDELIVRSVYRLDLKSPKKSIVRNGMSNRNTKKILKELERHTILGREKETFLQIIIDLIYSLKDIDIESYAKELLKEMEKEGSIE